jgi:hypothetical protein
MNDQHTEWWKYFHKRFITAQSKIYKPNFFPGEAWFTLRKNINTQNNIHWCNENPHAVSVHTTTQLEIFEDTNSD